MSPVDFLEKWQGVIYLIGSLLIAWGVWSANRGFVPREEHDGLKTRVQVIEGRLENIPSKDQITALLVEIAHLQGRLDTANAKFKGIENLSERMQKQVDRVEEFLQRRGVA